MAITARVQKIIWGKSGARCAFPGCRHQLVTDLVATDGTVVVGEIAHIVAQSPGGPRAQYPPPGGFIDAEANLILLCEEHHKLIDSQPQTYPVEKLLQMKTDHERWVNERLSDEERFQQVSQPVKLVCETIHSTLLPVNQMPHYVYTAPCKMTELEVKQKIASPQSSKVMLPFIIRGGNLITFSDLRDTNGPFHTIVEGSSAEYHTAAKWWGDQDYHHWYVTLLNRALNKLTGHKGLHLDKEHQRYFFPPGPGPSFRSIKYRSLSGRKTSRQVVWRPKLKHSGEYRHYWEHMAVSLRFHHVTETSWCLSIRPERRFTRDGYISLTPKGIGRRSTSRKSHMYNVNVLKEVDFWRDFLSDGRPRIIFNFGSQNLIVDTELMSTEITWPGVPDDIIPFDYTYYPDDLFSYADYQEALAGEDGFVEWEIDDSEDEGGDYA